MDESVEERLRRRREERKKKLQEAQQTVASAEPVSPRSAEENKLKEEFGNDQEFLELQKKIKAREDQLKQQKDEEAVKKNIKY
jgi:hypothetical protein